MHVQLYSVHYLPHSTKTTNLHKRDFPKEIFREITYILFKTSLYLYQKRCFIEFFGQDNYGNLVYCNTRALLTFLAKIS